MAIYPQELAQDAVCQSHTGHMTGLWFMPARPLRLNTNEWMNDDHYKNDDGLIKQKMGLQSKQVVKLTVTEI